MFDSNTPDDWWPMRVDALEFVRVAFNVTEGEAEKYLLDYACDNRSFEWRYERRVTVTAPQNGDERGVGDKRYRFTASPPVGWEVITGGDVKKASAGPPLSPGRTPSPDREDIDAAIRAGFWRQIRKGLGCAEGNSATYAGPVFSAFCDAEVRHTPGGLERSLAAQDVVAVDTWWWIEIQVSAIRFRAAPLIADVRSRDGLIDAAIEHLQSRGRLPRSPPEPSAAPESASEPPRAHGLGPEPQNLAPQVMKAWVPRMVDRDPPRTGETRSQYIDRVLMPKRPNPQWRRHSLQNELAKLDWP
jgi:hypothetical protein